MIFQIGALAVLALLVLYAFGQRRRSGPLSYGIILAALAGAVLVIFPDLSTTLAHAVGVGRGADLVLRLHAHRLRGHRQPAPAPARP